MSKTTIAAALSAAQRCVLSTGCDDPLRHHIEAVVARIGSADATAWINLADGDELANLWANTHWKWREAGAPRGSFKGMLIDAVIGKFDLARIMRQNAEQLGKIIKAETLARHLDLPVERYAEVAAEIEAVWMLRYGQRVLTGVDKDLFGEIAWVPYWQIGQTLQEVVCSNSGNATITIEDANMRLTMRAILARLCEITRVSPAEVLRYAADRGHNLAGGTMQMKGEGAEGTANRPTAVTNAALLHLRWIVNLLKRSPDHGLACLHWDANIRSLFRIDPDVEARACSTDNIVNVGVHDWHTGKGVFRIGESSRPIPIDFHRGRFIGDETFKHGVFRNNPLPRTHYRVWLDPKPPRNLN